MTEDSKKTRKRAAKTAAKPPAKPAMSVPRRAAHGGKHTLAGLAALAGAAAGWVAHLVVHRRGGR